MAEQAEHSRLCHAYALAVKSTGTDRLTLPVAWQRHARMMTCTASGGGQIYRNPGVNSCVNDFDTPPGPMPHGFSVLRGGLRHPSLKALPKPFYVLRGIVVAVQAYSAVRAGVPADGEPLLHHHTTT
jgi:hypothetical protein